MPDLKVFIESSAGTMRQAAIAFCILVLLQLGGARCSCAGEHHPASDDAASRPASSAGTSREFHPTVPQVWDDGTLGTLELPLADPKYSPVEVPWDYYYRLSERPIYKSYPVYAPGREPPGYFEWLRRQEPEVVWGIDSGGTIHKPPLATRADWIKAGEIVFDAPVAYDTDGWGSAVVSAADVRNPAWYKTTRTPVAADGVIPFTRYVIRKKGVVELGQQSCGMCHTRVMARGEVVKGAQGNFPLDRAAAFRLQMLATESKNKKQLVQHVRSFLLASFDAPWVQPGLDAKIHQLSLDQIIGALAAIPPGVTDRDGSSFFHPVQIPDLIGLKDRHYLDHTGRVQQRSMSDLMTYSALNQGLEDFGRYGHFIPQGIEFKTLPEPDSRFRYRDDQLYALAFFIYSLKPPPNPNQFDALAGEGQRIFRREGCARCHTPPLYTNNKLTLAKGFAPTAAELKEFEIVPISVGTDPALALKTRRGTGFYKVPSLKGVWYRGMFSHDGSCATLEDWFNPRRLRDDYVPTGFKGYGVKARAVTGHPFGLDLSPVDKKALIAYLKTL